MVIPKIKRVAHVVLYVRDPPASARWYADVLGMKVVTQVSDGPYRGGIFLSFGEHDHDIALFPTAETGRGKEFEHIGLEADCGGNLEELRRLYGSMVRHNVRISEVLDHGVSIGIYFFDPDGHQLEVFCQTIDGEAAIAELHRNEGQATPITFEPLFE